MPLTVGQAAGAGQGLGLPNQTTRIVNFRAQSSGRERLESEVAILAGVGFLAYQHVIALQRFALYPTFNRETGQAQRQRIAIRVGGGARQSSTAAEPACSRARRL